MTTVTHKEARSLIVVSRGQEELSLAMSFVRGQEFASRATILLPGILYPHLGDSLPVPALPYGSADDILGATEKYQPDLVFLFSGYLLTIEGLSVNSLDAVVRRLRDRGCCIMTSDPFLGLLPRLTLAQTDTRMLTLDQPAWRRWLIRLAVRLRERVIDVPRLDDVVHLYPTAIPPPEDEVPRLTFFNPTIVRGAGSSRAGADEPGQGGPHTARPRWLFTLSDLELRCQEALLGPREFTECLLGMLRHAVEAERDSTLIAPPAIVRRLANVLPASVELLPFSPPAEFEKRLLDAEYAFSWNAFSVSHLVRLANGLPVFLFDRGYYSRTIKPFYAIARECHFGGWEPTYVDQRQLFSPYVLAHLAKEQRAPLRALRERWQSSPTPDAVVDQVLGAGVRAGSA